MPQPQPRQATCAAGVSVSSSLARRTASHGSNTKEMAAALVLATGPTARLAPCKGQLVSPPFRHSDRVAVVASSLWIIRCACASLHTARIHRTVSRVVAVEGVPEEWRVLTAQASALEELTVGRAVTSTDKSNLQRPSRHGTQGNVLPLVR